MAFFIGLVSLSPLHALAEKTAANSANAAAGMAANEGKVLSTLDASGYTYMELANIFKAPQSKGRQWDARSENWNWTGLCLFGDRT